MENPLVMQFHERMIEVYLLAIERAKYRANIFIGMVSEHGGLETAKRLIHSSTVSDGYSELWKRNHLELTVEAVIYDEPQWQPLFTHDELSICEKRLRDYQYLK